MKKIAIFASGSGTNAENIIQFFRTTQDAQVDLLLCNKPDAGALVRAEKHDVQTHIFNREQFYQSEEVLDLLVERKIDLLVLAGFLWLVPSYLLAAFPGRVVNIHPALLPKYGGKGMYGSKVHEAVIAAGEKESGITIHLVNERYDEGDILFQAKCSLEPGDTADTLATKIHELEYRHFPGVIQDLIDRL